MVNEWRRNVELSGVVYLSQPYLVFRLWIYRRLVWMGI
jgi:hypothetical protein